MKTKLNPCFSLLIGLMALSTGRAFAVDLIGQIKPKLECNVALDRPNEIYIGTISLNMDLFEFRWPQETRFWINSDLTQADLPGPLEGYKPICGDHQLAKVFSGENLLKPSKIEVSFKQTSHGGSALQAEFRITNPDFKKLLGSGKDNLTVIKSFSLMDCDGRSMNASTNWDGDIESIVDSFKEVSLDQFNRCRFRTVVGADERSELSDDSIGVEIFLQRVFYMTYANNGAGALFGADNYGQMTTGILQLSAPPPAKKSSVSDSEKAKRLALDGAQQFISELKAHGKLLLDLTLMPELSEEQRNQAIRGSLENRKSKMVAALNSVNANFAKLSFLDKLAVTQSIESAYALYHQIELRKAKILDSRNQLDLGDELIKRDAN